MKTASFSYSRKAHAAAHTTDYLFNQLIPYIGNKRKLLWLIDQAVQKTGVHSGTFVDFFAGSGVVSRFAKQRGFKVIANDWEPYAKFINQCYIQCNTMPAFEAFGGTEAAFGLLNAAAPIDGYVATHLCPKNDADPDHGTERQFFTRANGMKIDATRELIQAWFDSGKLTPDEFAILVAAMMYSVSYVSNTSGVFKGFHRGWGGNTGTALYRILSDFELRLPVLLDNGHPNEARQMDAQSLAEEMRGSGRTADIAYLDPPYNQHPYGSNYHVLNTVALWDKPELPPHITPQTKSAIRLDWRTERRSAYNHTSALSAYQTLIETIPARYLLTSYSTDGNMPLHALLEASAQRGHIGCVTNAYKRYRVSTQRMSAKPMNVEFVLVIDTSAKAKPGDIEMVYEEIMSKEKVANAAHSEMQGDGQLRLY